jgi:hypothetical protein
MTDPPPLLLRTSRRGFLGLAGASASLAALSRLRPTAASAAPSGAAPDEAPFFDARATGILTAIVERMVDTGEPGAPPVRSTRTIETIDRLCGGLDPALTDPLPLALQLVEWGPYVFDWKLARFTALAPADQDASLEGWRTSRFATRRLAFYALRNLALFGYWSQDATWPLIGYGGPLLRPEAGA